MLIDFFYTLRAAKLPVSVREYLNVLEALQANVVGPASDACSIDDFYHLSRTIMVKDEKHYDKFDKAFGADTREKSKTKESWEWAMGLELVNVLSFLTQLFVIAFFFFALSPLFAGLNMLMVLLVLQVMGVLFKRQLKKQRGFVEKKRAKKEVTPAERLGSRIQQAEFGTLLASFGVVVLLGVLIWFSLDGVVSLSNTIVLFLGLRLQNTTFSSVSSSLMRFARAKANSF